MLASPLVPLSTVNSTVDDGVSGLIARLLNLDDGSRPTAEDAEAECRELLAKLTSRPPTYAPIRTSGIQFSHVVRDIIHGDIRLTYYEYRILNTPQMQRLREVKQLGLTNYVYIGADHSRLAHSLGTL